MVGSGRQEAWRQRAKMGFMVAVKEDVKSAGTREEDADSEMEAGDWLWLVKQPKGEERSIAAAYCPESEKHLHSYSQSQRAVFFSPLLAA